MRTKLTLRLDEDLIKRAKAYSNQNGKSVSQIVEDFFSQLLKQTQDDDAIFLPPLTASLKGVLSGSKLDRKDYRKYLEGKHK